jgi:hypothetical protein
MSRRALDSSILLILATVFTIGLTFASLELPYWIDELIQETGASPGFDSFASETSRIKTELYIKHYHLRSIGYICFGLTLVLIVVGFATQKTGLAALGALAFMLPVFAQFAGVMFFLAGLGALNVLWFPMLDLSFDVQKLGLIIRLPYDLVMWGLRQVGINGYWPLVYFFVFFGLLIFLLGTFAWLIAQRRGTNVADFWLYRISRHPQYLGWIFWSYGVFLLLLQMRYPRRSWGIDASLPWLLSTMVIIGVALLEELKMSRQFGDQYEEYRQKTPFLFPVPGFIGRLFLLPLKLFHCEEQPRSRKEVVFLVSTYTLVLVGCSALFYVGGFEHIQNRLMSSDDLQLKIGRSVDRMVAAEGRRRYFVSQEVAEFGQAAAPQLIDLLKHKDPEVRYYAAVVLGELKSQEAVDELIQTLSDADEDVRWKAMEALREIGDPAAKEAIKRQLEDPSEHIRLTAIRVLARLGAEELLDEIVPFLESPEYWTRVRVVEALGDLGSEKAVPVLIRMTDDEDPHVRRAVVVALMRIGSLEALPTILKATEDPDWELRLYAEEALKKLGS